MKAATTQAHACYTSYFSSQDLKCVSIKDDLVASLLLVAMPFAPSSVLVPSSTARSPQ